MGGLGDLRFVGVGLKFSYFVWVVVFWCFFGGVRVALLKFVRALRSGAR